MVDELARIGGSVGVSSEAPSSTPVVTLHPPLLAPARVVTEEPPARPSGDFVNEMWRVTSLPRRGVKGRVASLLLRFLRPELEAQERFNAAQVRLDNELAVWIEERFAVTHRHYDAVLGQVGRHLGEIDTRHLMLQGEVVKHTHDLVKRIDLVLAEAERSRMDLAQALRDVRDRLLDLERKLGAE